MASMIDIWNLAVSHIGDDANLVSADDGPVAEHCARFYPIARDQLLEKHAWNFSTRTKALTAVDYEVDGWDYAYALPTGFLKALQVYAEDGRWNPDSENFEIEIDDEGNQVLLCNVENAICRYAVRIEDTTRFSPMFVETLGWLLAAMVAGPVIKGETGAATAKSCMQVYLTMMGEATRTDSASRRVHQDNNPTWMAARA
jgi:hypothetical protein